VSVTATSLSDFDAISLDGRPVDLADYLGQVVLVVNTASQCGFTPQLEGLQELQDTYGERGFTVLGFPCDQFGHQEPGTEEEIGAFCQKNYGVTFPMFSKIEVNGDGAHPLYQWLRSQKGGLLGSKIKWNFTKFLLGKDGRVLDRYAPTTTPAKIAGDVEKALAA
jgi:glutathione peroxidase